MCDFFCKPASGRDLARQYWGMVDSEQVRRALRQLRTDANLTPEEFADKAGVNRATVYRIEKMEKHYSPRIDTILALVSSRQLTLAYFFDCVERGALHELSLGGTRSHLTQPPPKAGAHDDPVVPSASGGAVLDHEHERDLIASIGATVAAYIDAALGRSLAARQQAASPRPDETAGDADHRKSS